MTPTISVWFAIYTCLSGPSCPKDDFTTQKAYFSKQSCEYDTKLIAQSMFITSKNKYGFRCVPVEYDPPNLEKSSP